MKASEVLRRYAAGERNFQGVNLRGQSFKGKNLSGADFSQADLRSTNFTRANLKGVNFAGARCGLQKRWVTLLTISSCFLASISGLFSIFISSLILLVFDFSLENTIAGWISLLIIVVSLVLIIRQGIGRGAIAVAGTVAIAATVSAAIAGTVAVASAMTFATAIAIVVVVAVVGIFAIAVAGAFAVAGIFATLVASAVAGIFAIAGIFATSVAGAVAGIFTIFTVTVIGVIAGVGIYIAWRAMKGDERDAWLRRFIVAFAATNGTSFRSANLTEANFTGARLKSTDLRQAHVTRVRWYGAKMLDRIRPGDTYLKSSQVRQWLIGKGDEKNFDGQKLQGVNFQGVDLTDASFIDANLSEANLQDADLSRAKLVQTQLDKTDFTGAILTGAYIEDWGITANTVLQGVRCEYVYMRLPTDDNPEPYRKPDNHAKVFADGDFADFIKPIFDTLDLYHNQGVDPRAIAISVKELAENHPDEALEIVAMERKGMDKLLVRVKTKPEADRSVLSSEYFSSYNKYKGLSQAELRALLIEKNTIIKEKARAIERLENMIGTSLNSSIVNIENYSMNVKGNIEYIENIKDIDSINIEENIEKIENYREVENTNVKGNIEKIGIFTGDSNEINISGNTVIGQINSGRIEGEIENIENIQTAELVESNRKDLEIEIIKGSGMLVAQTNELVLRVTNTSNKILNSTLIELQDSGEYEIQGDNSITLSEIESRESIDISFKLLMKVAKEIAVNYKINNILQEKPLYIFAIQDNPYIYGSPVQGEVLFFGRKGKLNTILQAVIKPTKQDILIVGERRTGKTSLLNQIYKSFKSPLIPVYIVLNTSKYPSAEGVLDLILKQVIDKLVKQKILNDEEIKITKFENLEFIKNIENIIKIAQENLPDIRVILLIDEADYLLQIKQNSSNTIDERPQHFLRAVLQSETGKYLPAVVAGTTELSTYMSHNSSPFYNHFKHSRLKPFSGEDTKELIIRPAAKLGYEYSEQAIQQIINLSGGQPYYCQAICYESFNNALEYKRKEINADDVEIAQKKIVEDLFDGYLSGFWHRFSESEKRFVSSLTKNRPRKNINQAHIKRLLDWNIILFDKSSRNYRFSSDLIKQWTIMASNQ